MLYLRTTAASTLVISLAMPTYPTGGVPHVREQDGARGQPRWGLARGMPRCMRQGTARTRGLI